MIYPYEFVYVVKKNVDRTPYIERITYNQWLSFGMKCLGIKPPATEEIKNLLESKKETFGTYYRSLEEAIENNEFSTINDFVYSRVFDPLTKHFVKVQLSLLNNQDLEALGGKKEQEIKKKIAQKHYDVLKQKKAKEIESKKNLLRQRAVNDNMLNLELGEHSNLEIMLKWRSLGFCMPAPKKVREIKKTLKMNWKDFEKYILTL